MLINISIDNECGDNFDAHPWQATITILDDDGRVIQSDAIGQGATVREAIEDSIARGLDEQHDHHWLYRSWFTPAIDPPLIDNTQKVRTTTADCGAVEQHIRDQQVDHAKHPSPIEEPS